MRGALPTILAIGVKPLTLADIALCAPRDVFMMNITDLAHIADIVAAIGVIGSMIFVGVQVRQSTRSIRSATLQQQANQWQEYADLWQKAYAVLSDPRIATILAKGAAGRDLEQAEFNQFFLMCRSLLMVMESLHYRFQQGLIDKEVYARAQVSMQDQLFAFPGIRAMWQLTRHYHGSDFAIFLDEKVASTPIHQQRSSYKKWKELVAASSSKAISGGGKN
jgi:hypothetical protein